MSDVGLIGLVHENRAKAEYVIQSLGLHDVVAIGYGQALTGMRFDRLFLMIDLEHGNKEDRQYYNVVLKTRIMPGGLIHCLV